MQIVLYLEVRDLEKRESTVKAFSNTEDFNTYVEDAQVWNKKYMHGPIMVCNSGDTNAKLVARECGRVWCGVSPYLPWEWGSWVVMA